MIFILYNNYINMTIAEFTGVIAKELIKKLPVLDTLIKPLEDYMDLQWQKRIDKFIEELYVKISKLESSEIDIFYKIPNFSQIFVNVSHGAIKDISEDKIKYYVNSIISVIRQENFNDSKIHIFLNYLREFSFNHIKILEFFNNPDKYFPKQTFMTVVSEFRNMTDEIKSVCPELIEDVNMFDIVTNELHEKGLLKHKDILCHTNLLKFGSGIEKCTTNLGDEFLNFIDY